MPVHDSRVKPPDDSLVSHTSDLSDGTTNTNDRKRWRYQALRKQLSEKGRLDTYPFSPTCKIAIGASSGIAAICSLVASSGAGDRYQATGMHAHARHDSRITTNEFGVAA